MSASGQTRSFGDVCVMSAFPPIATERRTWRHFAFGPGTDLPSHGMSARKSENRPLLDLSVFVRTRVCRQVAGLAENSNSRHERITRHPDRVRWHVAKETVFRTIRQRCGLRELRPAVSRVSVVNAMHDWRDTFVVHCRLRAERYSDRREQNTCTEST
jgi:hypothetical protein